MIGFVSRPPLLLILENATCLADQFKILSLGILSFARESTDTQPKVDWYRLPAPDKFPLGAGISFRSTKEILMIDYLLSNYGRLKASTKLEDAQSERMND